MSRMVVRTAYVCPTLAVLLALFMAPGCSSTPKQVQLVSPQDGDTVWAQVKVVVRPVNIKPADSAVVFADGNRSGSVAEKSTDDAFQYYWDSSTLPGGASHTLSASCYSNGAKTDSKQAKVVIADQPAIVYSVKPKGGGDTVDVVVDSRWSTVSVCSLTVVKLNADGSPGDLPRHFGFNPELVLGPGTQRVVASFKCQTAKLPNSAGLLYRTALGANPDAVKARPARTDNWDPTTAGAQPHRLVADTRSK